MAITRDQILAAKDAVIERLEVPEWALNGDASLYIREFVAGNRFALADYASGPGGAPKPEFYAAACCYGICDQDGNYLLTMPQDLAPMLGRSAKVVERVARAILKLNGLTAQAEEEAEKNSGQTVSGDLPFV